MSEEAAKMLVAITQAQVRQAQAELNKLKIELAADEARCRAWTECNPGDGVGGMSGSPYARSAERYRDSIQKQEQRLILAENAYDLLVTRIIDVFVPSKPDRTAEEG